MGSLAAGGRLHSFDSRGVCSSVDSRMHSLDGRLQNSLDGRMHNSFDLDWAGRPRNDALSVSAFVCIALRCHMSLNFWVGQIQRGRSVCANASIQLALSAHTVRLQLSVYSASQSWCSGLSQDVPSRCLASAGTPVIYCHFCVFARCSIHVVPFSVGYTDVRYCNAGFLNKFDPASHCQYIYIQHSRQ